MSNELTTQKINLSDEIKKINKNLGKDVDSIEIKYKKYIKNKQLNDEKYIEINSIEEENKKLKAHNLTLETLIEEYLLILNTKKQYIQNSRLNKK